MLNRALVIDEYFQQAVRAGEFPAPRTHTTPAEAGLSREDALHLFDTQLMSRHLDLSSRVLKDKNLAYYTIGSSGHEGNAAIAHAFRNDDMAFLHYRDAAFLLQRLRAIPEKEPLYELMLSFLAAAEDPVSGGRHKVLGSVEAFVPPQTSTIASHLPKAVGAAFSITLARELKHVGKMPNNSVILCSFGDASLNHSVSQGAINAATWIAYGSIPLPLVFICEDNGIGISVPTPQTWVEQNIRARPGWHYIAADGLNFADTYRAASEAAYIARVKRQPVFLHMRCVRLMGHAGSDVEQQYKTSAEIEANERQDPLLHSARILIEQGYLNTQQILERYASIAAEVNAAAARALQRPKLLSAKEVMSSLLPPKNKQTLPAMIDDSVRAQKFGAEFAHLSQKRNLCQNINYALTDLMLQYPNIVVYGEDVAKKGGVYRVTAGLMEKFGRRRVFDSLLDETTILGHAIGLAHNGFLPIPEIQFLAYYHNAEDQIRGEASTLSFFSRGNYTNPMVIRIAGLAYQKGFGGHFHNDNSFAAIRDIPGVIVACPSNGLDAGPMLRECVRLAYQEQRVVIFLEPIALYMTKDLHVQNDQLWLYPYVPPSTVINYGGLAIVGEGTELAIVTYGNGFYLSLQAQKILREQHGMNVRVIDLRWLVPLHEENILRAVKGCKSILIVDEARRTGSLSEQLMTLFYEHLSPLPKLQRLCAEDCFIPLGAAWEFLLPSRDSIVAASLSCKQKRTRKTGSE